MEYDVVVRKTVAITYRVDADTAGQAEINALDQADDNEFLAADPIWDAEVIGEGAD